MEADDPLVDLVESCLHEIERDGPLALERYCRSHPDHAEALRRRIDFLQSSGLLDLPEGFESPERLGPYELGQLLGSGGMGVVYEAKEVGLERDLALKILRPERVLSEANRERFRREAQAVASLSHPGIVRVYDAGIEDGLPYFSMERVAGMTLAERLEIPAGSGPLDPRSAVDYIRQASMALAYAHSRGVLHRDLKLSNLMLDQAGRIRVLDFGLALTGSTDRMTRPGALLGTRPYMAPEQIDPSGREVDERTDIYGLGVCLYELLAGRRPFGARTHDELGQSILAGNAIQIATLATNLPRGLESIVHKAMAAHPEDRYQSMQEFGGDLRNLLDGHPVKARPDGPWRRIRRGIRLHPARSLTVSAAGLMLLTGAILFLRSARERSRLEQQRIEARDKADRLLLGVLDKLDRTLSEDRELSSLPYSSRLREATREEMLDLEARVRPYIRAGTEFGPRLARILVGIATQYRLLGEPDAVRPRLEEAGNLLGAPREARGAGSAEAKAADGSSGDPHLDIRFRLQEQWARYHSMIGERESALHDWSSGLRMARDAGISGVSWVPVFLEGELQERWVLGRLDVDPDKVRGLLQLRSLGRFGREGDLGPALALSRAHKIAGEYSYSQQELDRSEQEYESALAILESVKERIDAKSPSPVWYRLKAELHSSIGSIANRRGKPGPAAREYGHARHVLGLLVDAFAGQVDLVLLYSMAALNEARALIAARSPKASLDTLRAVRTKVQDQEELVGRSLNLADTQDLLHALEGYLLTGFGRTAQAIGLLEGARAGQESRVESHPGQPDLNVRLSATYRYLAAYAARIGDADLELEMMSKSVAQKRLALDASPKSVNYRRNLAFTLLELADVEAKAGNDEAAREIVLEILKKEWMTKAEMQAVVKRLHGKKGR